LSGELKHGAWDAAQAGLCIAAADAGHQEKQYLGGPVAEAGTGRDAGGGKIAYAEYKAPFTGADGLGDFKNVRGRVLAVGIGGDNAVQVGKYGCRLGYAGFQGRTLAAVYIVPEDMGAQRLRFVKYSEESGRAAVVYYDESLQSQVLAFAYYIYELFIRVQSGDQNDSFH